MTLHQFITQNNIQAADAIMMRKKNFGMLDHYVIYLGFYKGEHRFIANYTKGVRYLSNQEINTFLSALTPTKIEPFKGNEAQRIVALNRAVNRIGEKAYSYITNNCEHFKNYVHYGKSRSLQSENAMQGAAIVAGSFAVLGIISALFSND